MTRSYSGNVPETLFALGVPLLFSTSSTSWSTQPVASSRMSRFANSRAELACNLPPLLHAPLCPAMSWVRGQNSYREGLDLVLCRGNISAPCTAAV